MLAARPVVPLSYIRQHSRTRYLRSALIVVISGLVGAVATLILVAKEHSTQTKESQTQYIESKAQDFNNVSNSGDQTASAENFNTTESAGSAAMGAKGALETNDKHLTNTANRRKRLQFLHNPQQAEVQQAEPADMRENGQSGSPNLKVGSGSAQNAQVESLKPPPAREGVRERRVTTYKKRRNSPDDLMRIREIFEGVRHP